MSKVSFNMYCCVLLVLQIAIAVYGTVTYVPNFTGIEACKDFKNECFNLDNVEITTHESSEGEEKGVGLSGPMNFCKPITEEHELAFSVKKSTEMGKERMFSAMSMVCESIKQDDAPWSPMVKQMKVSGCPIKAASYLIEDYKVPLSSIADSNEMTDLCVGQYDVEMKMMNGSHIECCYVVSMEMKKFEG